MLDVRRLAKVLFFMLFHLIALVVASVQALAESATLDDRFSEIEISSGGRLGVAAIDLSNGDQILFRADEPFPMASTYKVAIASAALALVDEQKLSLDQMIPIREKDYVYGGPVAAQFPHDGLSLSLSNLVDIMITASDNSATDALLALIGGPKSVNLWLEGNGIRDMDVARTTAEIVGQYYGIPRNPDLTLPQYASIDPAMRNPAFEKDLRDHATPAAMLHLLEKIAHGGVLSPQSTEFLISSLKRTATAPDRLKAATPRGAVLAHKSGTIGASSGDVGIFYLPDGRWIVIAVYVAGSDKGFLDRDIAIAAAARNALAALDGYAGEKPAKLEDY